MKKLFPITILITLLVSSCQPVNRHRKNDPSDNKLDQLSWMLGKWEMKTPEGTITEQWDKPSDTQWHGVSYMVNSKGDTPFHERIHLRVSGDTLYYLPAVAGQNAGQEVSFMEKTLKDGEVVFENLLHDFPQRISYTRTSDTSIVAAIEGSQNGQSRREEFIYNKVD